MLDPVMDDTTTERFSIHQTPTQTGPSYLIVMFGVLFACLLLVLTTGVILELFGASH